MRVDADVAVVGAGFAGSLTALALRSIGRSVVLVERGRHPRFAIGESSTPLANLLLEELADRYDLPRIRVFSKWGTWQRARPDVGGGLKRGFTFFFHRPGERFGDDPDHERQLMVAASPHDDIGDTHWYRPDFDHNLVREAEAAGAIYTDETVIDRVAIDRDRSTLEGTRLGQPVRISASFVVDASGPRGLLSRSLRLGDRPLRWLPPTQGLYTHFEDVTRWDRLRPQAGAPYPPDDAAVHHVFPGGWIWMLRFNNGITSAGAALTDQTVIGSAGTRGSGLEVISANDGASAWERLLAMLPAVRDQFAGARAIHPWIRAPRLAFRTTRVAGPGWALLPSAAGVIDPLLSTGFPLTLLGIQRLLGILERTSSSPEHEAALREYERITLAELDATEQLVAALYACPPSLRLRPARLRDDRSCRSTRPGTRGAARGDRSCDRAVRRRRPQRSLTPRLVPGAGRRSHEERFEAARVAQRSRPAAGSLRIQSNLQRPLVPSSDLSSDDPLATVAPSRDRSRLETRV